MAVFLSWGVWRILRITFGNCESSVSSIKVLRVILANWEFEDPPCVSVFSRYVQLMLQWVEDIMYCTARGLSKHMGTTGNWEKREHSFSWSVSKVLRKDFFLAPGSPSFSACADFDSCYSPPGNLFLYLFISFCVYFIFYVIIFIFLI